MLDNNHHNYHFNLKSDQDLMLDNFQPRGFALRPRFTQQVNFLDVQRRPGATPLVLTTTININNYYHHFYLLPLQITNKTPVSLSAGKFETKTSKLI